MATVRFGDYIREITLHASQISYSNLMPEVKHDESGEEIPFQPGKLKLRRLDLYRLLAPYLSVRFMEQVRAVVPLALYLGLFQIVILHKNVSDASTIALGLLAVMVGLMLFMEGLKLGMMPFGEMIGHTLPQRVRLPVVLLITFILGVGVTFAEPAIGALQIAGSVLDPSKAPYLHSLLTGSSMITVLVVGAGVGIAAVLGTLRFVYGWSLKPLIYLTLIPTLLMTIVLAVNPETAKIIGMSWDCGAVTTGPVTVPLVLALGIGVSSAIGRKNDSLSGFGIVTLASILPIFGVLVLGGVLALVQSPQSITETAIQALTTSSTQFPLWHETSPVAEIIMGFRAIIPLVLFLVFVLSIILHEKLKNSGIIRYGITLSIIGMILFNLGLTYGLSKLGEQSGTFVPGTFIYLDQVTDSPLFNKTIGIFIASLFAWILGFGATLAEPALNAMGVTVENLTCGAFRKNSLMYSVSFGVAMGIMLGVVKLIFGFSILYIVIPGYVIALILTYLSSEEFVNVGWDSAGVTTGPVTVPLVLAMGLGFGKATGALEGFGILAAASICPIVSVLTLGLYLQRKAKMLNMQHSVEQKENAEVLLQ